MFVRLFNFPHQISLSIDSPCQSTVLVIWLFSSIDFPHQLTFLVNWLYSSINFPHQSALLIIQLPMSLTQLIMTFKTFWLVLYYTLFWSFVLLNYRGQGHLNKLNLKEVLLYKQLPNCFCLETVLLVKGEVEQCFFTSPWRIFLSHCSRWQVSSDRRDAFKCMHYSQRRGHSCITWSTIGPFRSPHPSVLFRT